MSDTIKTNNELDNYGRLTESMPSEMLGYNFKAIRVYCKENGKQLSELTYKEIEKFRNSK